MKVKTSDCRIAIDNNILTRVRKIMVTDFDKNIILYGPSIADTEYNVVIYAVAIIEGKNIEEVKNESYTSLKLRFDEYKRTNQIAVTKHSIQDGVFKEFCGMDNALSFDEAWDLLVADVKQNGNAYAFIGRTGLKLEAQLMNDELLKVKDYGELSPFIDITKEKVKSIYHENVYENRTDNSPDINKREFDACYAVIDTLIPEFNLKDPDEGPDNKVFIIEEINQGNLSQLIDEHSIQSNVYIIITMITDADPTNLIDANLCKELSFVEMIHNVEDFIL